MLQKSRELTQKLEAESDDEESEETMVTTLGQTGGDTRYSIQTSSNPWMSKATVDMSTFSRPAEMKNENLEDPKEDSDSESSNEQDISDVRVNNSQKSVSRMNILNNSVSVTTEEKASEITTASVAKDSDSNKDSEQEEDDIDDIFKQSLAKKAKKEMAKKKKKEKKKNKVIGSKKSEKKLKNKKVNLKFKNNEDHKSDEDNVEEDEMISEGLVRKRTLEEIEDLSDDEKVSVSPVKKKKIVKRGKENDSKKDKTEEPYIDPNKLFTMATKVKQVGDGPQLVGKFFLSFFTLNHIFQRDDNYDLSQVNKYNVSK